MQKQSLRLTHFAQTGRKYVQQQSLPQQLGHLRAAATCAAGTRARHLQQQQQSHLQLQQQYLPLCNSIRLPPSLLLLHKQQQQHPQQHQNHHHLHPQLPATLASLLMSASSSPSVSDTSQHQQQQQQRRCYSKFTAARDPPLLSHPLCEERAHDLVINLKDSERAAIKAALEKYDALRQKEGFEGKLAATQWRTRFGRLSKVPTLGEVDPTGSFCAFPDDWLKKKAVEKAKQPSSSDLWKIFFVNAVPFMAFGFLDNFTMIIAGDYIEQVFGYFMCISTMAAAGLGNTISDILGIGSAFYVERGCEFLGLRPPDLTPIQMEMKASRRSANYGRIIGITVGCLVGMLPLLFMDKKPTVEGSACEETASPTAQSTEAAS